MRRTNKLDLSVQLYLHILMSISPTSWTATCSTKGEIKRTATQVKISQSHFNRVYSDFSTMISGFSGSRFGFFGPFSGFSSQIFGKIQGPLALSLQTFPTRRQLRSPLNYLFSWLIFRIFHMVSSLPFPSITSSKHEMDPQKGRYRKRKN